MCKECNPLFYVSIFTRSEITGLSEWKFARPEGHMTRPYKFTRSEAEDYVKALSNDPDNWMAVAVDQSVTL